MIVGGSFTYSGHPETDDHDAVRFLIGDTDERDPKVSDEEILWALRDAGNRYSAAALCARQQAALAGGGSVTVGDMSETGPAAAEWHELADQLERRAVVALGPQPYLGGSKVTDKRTAEADSDRTQPGAFRRQFDREGASWPWPSTPTRD